MGQKKLLRFRAIDDFEHVLQYPEDMQGKWHEFFGNDNPITLELACGKGEYSVGLGRQHKDRNYIGVDIKGNRIFIGAKQAKDEGLKNVGFLRTHILQIQDHFAVGEVDDIWIIFPDPFLRDSREKNRLTHPRFLYRYQQILKKGGKVNLKTDSKELFDYTLEVIKELGCEIVTCETDIYGKGLATGPLAIRTFYEEMHLANGRLINYVSFHLPEKEIEIEERHKKHEPVKRGG